MRCKTYTIWSWTYVSYFSLSQLCSAEKLVEQIDVHAKSRSEKTVCRPEVRRNHRESIDWHWRAFLSVSGWRKYVASISAGQLKVQKVGLKRHWSSIPQPSAPHFGHPTQTFDCSFKIRTPFVVFFHSDQRGNCFRGGKYGQWLELDQHLQRAP